MQPRCCRERDCETAGILAPDYHGSRDLSNPDETLLAVVRCQRCWARRFPIGFASAVERQMRLDIVGQRWLLGRLGQRHSLFRRGYGFGEPPRLGIGGSQGIEQHQMLAPWARETHPLLPSQGDRRWESPLIFSMVSQQGLRRIDELRQRHDFDATLDPIALITRINDMEFVELQVIECNAHGRGHGGCI